MAKKRMVDGWLCWFWVDKDNVIQHFSSDRGRPPKGCKLVHADASVYKLRRGLDAPWLNSDGTTRLLAPAVPVVDVEPVKSIAGLAKGVEPDPEAKGYVETLRGDDSEDEDEETFWARVAAEEKAKK